MKKIFYWAALLFTAVTMVACDDNDDNNDKPKPPVVTDVELSGTITENLTLDPAVEYTITGSVNVKSGATLTIPAGMTIKAQKGFASYILVEQGGKININGTAAAPVTLTSAEASPKAGDWGGLIINGRTPLTGGVTGSTEISSTIPYGGSAPTDNSGSITYLKLEYTGAQDPADDEVEHNGLTLNAVGSGTRIENIFIIDGMDDGIEFFGGTVDVKNLLVVNPDDDMFDFTFGYSGTLTNAYGVWEAGHTSGESDPSGVEADGNLDGNQGLGANLQSDFTIENMTIDLRNAYDTDLTAQPKKYMQNALRIRRGATATITNALVKGSGYVENFVNLSDGKGGADTDSEISITNSLTGATKSFKFNEGDTEATYPGIAIEAGNTGCPTNIFGWTGYEM